VITLWPLREKPSEQGTTKVLAAVTRAARIEDHVLSCRDRTNTLPFLIGILVLAIGTRAIVLLTTSIAFFKDDHFWGFGYEMGQIAASLATGEGFSWPDWSSYPKGPTAWMPPIYPLLIAAAFKTFGVYSDQAAIFLLVVQTTFSVLTCFLLYLVGKRIFNAQTGLCAALLFAVYPPSIHFAVRQIWSTSLFAFCLLFVICIILHLSDYPRVKSGAYLGILLAFTALVDPIIIGVYPFAFGWLYLKAEVNRRIATKMITTAIVVFFVGLSPWLVRNYVVFGRFVFIKSNFGNELYLGNREGATGSYKDVDGAKVHLPAVEQEYLRQSDEPSRNSFLLRKAVTFILDKPLSFVQRTVNRIVHYWTEIRPQPGLAGQIVLTGWLTVLVLAVAGLALSGVKGRDIQFILLFILLLPVPYYLTHVAVFRYRFSIELLLAIFAAYTISWVPCLLRKTLMLTRKA
jgi:4-amino-4-deoxy-L-arabinose transferase-like glycosyltransferase